MLWLWEDNARLLHRRDAAHILRLCRSPMHEEADEYIVTDETMIEITAYLMWIDYGDQHKTLGAFLASRGMTYFAEALQLCLFE